MTRTRWIPTVGLLALAWTAAACSTPAGERLEPRRSSPPTAATSPSAVTPPTSAPPSPRASAERAEPALPDDLTLVWTRSRLPEGFAGRVSADPAVGTAMVGYVATRGLVRTADADGTVVDAHTGGWHLPVEVVTVAPEDHAAAFGTGYLGDLEPDEAVLGETSARVRALAEGGTLEFVDGTELTVAAVLPDEVVAGAEVLVSTGSPLPTGRPRFVLARPAEPGADLEPVLRSHLPGDLPATVAVPGDTPILRHADAVLSPARVKELFGEFAMRDAPGRRIEQDPDWVEAHIVTEEVPILGTVTCHRDLVPPLRAAMEQLVEEGRPGVVDPSDYAGCWSPRTQAVGEPLSHHAWGIAVDLNASANPFGGPSRQDPRLVEVMRQHGFTWGEPWLVPDPMHFEAGHGWEER